MDNKDRYGEFFTPNCLIDEILNQLPSHVWTDPFLKWLDPCAGKGNFFKRVFERLMKGLEIIIVDPVTRRGHIITKMLFMVEINQENKNDLASFFGINANIYFEDFLNPETPLHTKFNIILGNPPYQTSKATPYIGSVGNRTLWDKFLVKCMSLNEINGYIGFITPANWRRPNHKLYNKITKDNHLVYLHIYSKKDGLLYFDAQTRFDLYIIKNTKSNDSSVIVDEKGIVNIDIDLSCWPFLPNFAYENIKDFIITSFEDEANIKPVIFDSSCYDARKLSKLKDIEFKYPIVHTLTKKGIGLRYAKLRNHHFKSPKIILNVNEKQYPINDFQGNYGMSQLSFGIPIKSFSEGEQILKTINSSEFKELLSATKWGSFQTDYRMFKYLKLTIPMQQQMSGILHRVY